MITFFVSGVPKAMSVGGVARFKRGATVQMVPKRTNTEWATLVGHTGRQCAPERPLEGAVSLEIRFYLPRPTSASKRVVEPIKRPDLDNLLHKLTDQWNGVFWHDDSQVTLLLASKSFDPEGRVGAEFTVAPITNGGSER